MMVTHNTYQECISQICWNTDPSCELPVHCSRATLTSTQKSYLFQLYCKLYGHESDLYLSSIYQRYSHVTVNSKQLGSKKSRSASSSTVMALWNVNWFGPCSAESSDNIVTRAASINYFCKHSVTIKGVNKILACKFIMVFVSSEKYSVR